MFNTIKKWFGIGKNEERLDAAIERLEAKIKATNDLLASKDDEIRMLREQNAVDEERYSSTEPWVEIKGDSIHPVRGIEIKLDWNDAFIDYLQDNGIKGKDEDEVIRKWLSLLYADLASKFEQRAVDNTEFHRVNDFE